MKIPSKVGNPFQHVLHTSLDMSDRQFLRNKGIVEFFNLGSQRLWQQPGIYLFGDVGGTVAEQTAYNCHCKTIVDGKDCECVPGSMK